MKDITGRWPAEPFTSVKAKKADDEILPYLERSASERRTTAQPGMAVPRKATQDSGPRPRRYVYSEGARFRFRGGRSASEGGPCKEAHLHRTKTAPRKCRRRPQV